MMNNLDGNNIDELNKKLDFFSTDYQKSSKLKEELKDYMINKDTINNRLNTISNDINRYINNQNNDYNLNLPQNSTQYKMLNNKNLDVKKQNTQYNKNNHSLFKRESRDDMNERINSFNFVNHQNMNNKDNSNNPLINNNYYNTGPGIKANNPEFDNINNFNTIHTKIDKNNNRSINNDRMQHFSPLGKALGSSFNHNIGDNISELSSINSKNNIYKNNYKDIANERLNNITPLSRNISINTKQKQLINDGQNRQNNQTRQNRQSIKKTTNQNFNRQQIQSLNSNNFKDINHNLENPVMTYYPVNSRIE